MKPKPLYCAAINIYASLVRCSLRRLACLIFAISVPALLSAQSREIIWDNTDLSGEWQGGSQQWWHLASASTTDFQSGDAVVFGRAGSGAAITSGTIAIVNPVTLGAVGTNPGVLLESGTWAFTGAAVTGGGIRYSLVDDTSLAFDTRTLAQRITVDANATGKTARLGALEGSTLMITTATLASGNGAAVSVGAGSTFSVESTDTAQVIFKNNTAQRGGAVATTNGMLHLKGVAFEGNKSSTLDVGYGGGAVYATGANATLDLASSTFSGNSAGGNGGAIFAEGVKSVKIQSSVFTSNTASAGHGGALTVWNTPTVTLTDVSFTDNRATFSYSTRQSTGGAIYLNATHLVSNFQTAFNINVSEGSTSTYSGNRASATGAAGIGIGGMYNHKVNLAVNTEESGVLDMRDPIKIIEAYPFVTLTASKAGTGIWMLGGENKFTGTGGNTLTVNEGTLALYAGASLTLDNRGASGGTAAAAVEDTLTLAADATLATLGTGTNQLSSSATSTIKADKIVLQDGAALTLANSLTLTGTTLQYGNVAVTSNTTATLTLRQVTGPLSLSGTRSFDVADGENLTVDARFNVAANDELTFESLNVSGGYSGTATFTTVENTTGSGGVIQVNSGATFTATTANGASMAFVGNRALEGGAIYVNAGTLNLNGVNFSDNSTTVTTGGVGGGAIRSESASTLNITSGTFSNNVSGRHGGAVFAKSATEINITSVLFDRNIASGDGNGGAVTIWDTPTVILTDVSFTNNQAGEQGGALHFNITQASRVINATIKVSDGQTSTYSGNTMQNRLTPIANSITFAGGAASGLISLTADVGADGLLDMQDPMRGSTEHPVVKTAIQKIGEGEWRLGGNNALITTAGNDMTVSAGALALYTDAAISLQNDGATPAAAYEDKFLLEGSGTLKALGIDIAQAAAIGTASVSADRITLASDAVLVLDNSLSFTGSNIAIEGVATHASTDATLSVGVINGSAALSGSNTYLVDDGVNLTVAGRFVVASGSVASISAINPDGTQSGTTTFTAPAYTNIGGAIEIRNGASLTAEAKDGASLQFAGNSATQGAAIFVDTGTLNLSGVVFDSNTATDGSSGTGGGAIYVRDASTLNITSGTFSNNRSNNHGGAIFTRYWTSVWVGADVNISDALFTSNTAAQNGGALTVWNSSTITLTDVSFTDNTAETGIGGAINVNIANVGGFTTNLYVNVSEGATSTYSGNQDITGANSITFGAFDNGTANVTFNVGADGLLDMQDPLGVRTEWPKMTINMTKTGEGEWRLGGQSLMSGTGGNHLAVDEGTFTLYAGSSLVLDNTIHGAADVDDTFTLADGATLGVAGFEIDGTESYSGATLQADKITFADGSILSFAVGTTGGTDSGEKCEVTDLPTMTGATAAAGALTLVGSDFDYSAGNIKVNLNLSSYAEGDATVTLIDATGVSGLDPAGLLDVSKFGLSINGTEMFNNSRVDVHQLESTSPNTLDFFYHSTGNGVVYWTGSAANGILDEAERNWSFDFHGITYDQFLNGDTVVFDDTAAVVPEVITIADAGISITPSGSNPGIYFTGSNNWAFEGGSIKDADAANPAGILMDGTGTVTLGMANSYSGGTEINDGTVVAKHVAALGTGDVTNESQLVFDLLDLAVSGTMASNIAGTGTLTKTGAGTMITTGSIDNDLVVNGGGFGNAGQITGATTLQSGTFENAVNGTMTTLTQTGGVGINRGVATVVTVNGGSFINDTTGTTAAFTLNSGSANNAGYINGTATVAGGAMINSGTISGAVTQSAGSFVNNTGGKLADTLLVNGGTFTNSGGSVAGATTIGTGGRVVFKSGSMATIVADGTLEYANDGAYTQSAVISGSTGRIIKSGTGQLTLGAVNSFNGATDIDAGVLTLGVTGALAQSSTVTVGSGGALDLAGLDQTLKVLKTAAGGRVLYNSAGSAFRTLTISELAGTGGIFAMRTNLAAGTGDKLNITGANSGSHEIQVINENGFGIQPYTAIPLVITGSAGAVFSGTTESGNYILTVQKGDGSTVMPNANNWYLGIGDLASHAADAILGTAAVAGQDWHYELDSLYKRLGDVRSDPDVSKSGSVWVRANAYRLNTGTELTGYSFHQDAYGFTGGVDKGFRTAAAAWFVGGYGTINHIDRSFDNGGKGNTTSVGGGLYATWLHDTGWYADLVARVDRRKNDFEAHSVDGYLTDGDYNATSEGVSLELGKRINIPRSAFWVEPSLQSALVYMNGTSYDTESAILETQHVNIQDMLSSQSRAQVRVGGTFGFAPNLHPYARIGASYTATSRGEVRLNNTGFKVDYDGWRMEYGIGAAFNVSMKGQLYLDYEYAKADLYERPWAINLGYRYAW